MQYQLASLIGLTIAATVAAYFGVVHRNPSNRTLAQVEASAAGLLVLAVILFFIVVTSAQ